MSSHDDAIRETKEAIRAIEEARRSSDLPDGATQNNLQRIGAELKQIQAELESGGAPNCRLPWPIIDSWDYDHPLGREIARAYNRVKEYVQSD